MSFSALGLLSPASGSAGATTNAAIARCCEVWKLRYKAEKSKGEDEVFAAYYANQSFRDAMPALIGYEGIRDFIACVAYGMLIEAIQPQNGTQFLYAAQVALSTLRCHPDKNQVPKKQKPIAK
jgi:hypothetical protein